MGTFKVTFVARAIAERVGSALIDKALTLSNFLKRGRVVPELKNPAVREIFFKSYRIVYRLGGTTVEVLQVLARGPRDTRNRQRPIRVSIAVCSYETNPSL
jgi:plasmid stabilization system protein ParE